MKTVYSDESVWLPVSKGLRNRGRHVKTAHEQNNLGEPDREQLKIARENEYILLSFDDDFLTLVKKENLEHEGIIYVNQTGKRIGEVIKKVSKCLSQNPETSSIHYL